MAGVITLSIELELGWGMHDIGEFDHLSEDRSAESETVRRLLDVCEDLSILDLAPTFLHLHGSKIPTDLDGRVRTEVYQMGTDAAESEANHFEEAYENECDIEQSDEEGDVRDRLEDLGYLE